MSCTATAAVVAAAPATPTTVEAVTNQSAPVAAATFDSVLPQATGRPVAVRAFGLDRKPVSNGQYLAFVTTTPRWRRGAVASLFADQHYLEHWSAQLTLGTGALPDQPVTHVSWFAAKAYCEARGARLPTWHEWEYVAAADESTTDARNDPAWRQQILQWYSKPSGTPLARVGTAAPNLHGVYDMHGLVWEWVLDYNALLISSDSREQGGADRLQFCGEGALSTTDRDNYAVLMRIALLSSLEASFTVGNLGFRCAVDSP